MNNHTDDKVEYRYGNAGTVPEESDSKDEEKKQKDGIDYDVEGPSTSVSVSWNFYVVKFIFFQELFILTYC